jgi:hypothetical protein
VRSPVGTLLLASGELTDDDHIPPDTTVWVAHVVRGWARA